MKKYLLFAFVVMIAACDVATAPARVVNKTMETNNIIGSYEWFYDSKAQYDSRVSQLQSTKSFLSEESDPSLRRMLMTEFNAQQQSCRDLATRYNANSEKANKSIFKSKGLPETLSITNCEG